MPVQRREDLDTVTRLMLFPEEYFALGGVTFLELLLAHRMAPTRADREQFAQTARRHVSEVVMTQTYATFMLDEFNGEEASAEWRDLMRALLVLRMGRGDVGDLHSYYRQQSSISSICSESTQDLIVKLCMLLADDFDDWAWVYDALDKSDVRRNLVYDKLQTLASQNLSSALRFVSEIALPQASEEERPAVLIRAWETIRPHVQSTVGVLDVWERFRTFQAADDVLYAILDCAVHLAKTPRDTARLWAHKSEHLGDAFRAVRLGYLMEGYPSWTVEDWIDVLSEDERLPVLLASRMMEHFYPKLTLSRDALCVCRDIENTTVRERAFDIAVRCAGSVEDWQGIAAAVEEGAVKSHHVGATFHVAMQEAARTADDWINILRWPRASEEDRTAAVAALRFLLSV